MGSKMAAAARVVQVVKPHTPLIKFPDRKSSPRPKIQEFLQASVPSLHASEAQESAGGRSTAFQSISPVSRVQGTSDTSELARTLPQKYRRKLMSDDEIEYIQWWQCFTNLDTDVFCNTCKHGIVRESVEVQSKYG